MGQQRLIQQDQSEFSFNQSDIDTLVGNYSPKTLKVYLERALFHNYGAEDNGSRQTASLVVRAAIANSIRQGTNFGIVSIGQALGKNHATIVHIGKNHDIYLQSFPSYRIYYAHCIFIVNKVSKLFADAQDSYLEGPYNLDYMEKLMRDDYTRQRTIDKLQGMLNSIKMTLKKALTHDEKIRRIESTFKKKGDLIDPL
jgi:hypothetical protein